MAFKIKHIHPVLFKEIYTAGVAQQLDPFICGSRNWLCDLDDSRWAVDESRLACLLRTPLQDQKDSRLSYSFVWNGQVVLMQQQGWCRYRVVHASPMSEERIEEMKQTMTEVLCLGRELMRGVVHGNCSRDAPEPVFMGW